MPHETRIVAPGPRERTVRTQDGMVLEVPSDWDLLPPGDAGLTRRVKASGPTWTVQEKRGRKVFSRGVWADASRIVAIRETLDAERSTEQYVKRQAAAANRRERQQSAYVEDFHSAVLRFLNFAPVHARLADQLATAITQHATPIGSGTVARTERIPIEQRAESAVIAWMRHSTTAYDNMKIARVKGRRREVRRELAQQSRRILESYRAGLALSETCPLGQALANSNTQPAE